MKQTNKILLGLGVVITIFSACMPIMLVLLFTFQNNLYDRMDQMASRIETRLDDLSERIARVEGRLGIPAPDVDPISIMPDSLGTIDNQAPGHNGDAGLIISSFGN